MSAPTAPAPSRPWLSWAEPVGLAAWGVAAAAWAAWCWYGDQAFGPLHLVTAVGLALALALLARRGWVRLFGPVLLYEALRAARRPRFFLLRWLYAVGLLLLLLWVHSMWSMETRYRGDVAIDYKEQAKLAEEFFYAFAVVQFAAVVLLTPAYVAGGVAEEKERKTLEFLLATDLRGREIVFGKLLARLGNLALFVLAGLPVLSLMQFFGGIDPGLLLASFAATALTAASLAGLGILLSVQRRRARDAIVLTYLTAIGYIALASACLLIPPLLIVYRRTNGQLPTALDAWVESAIYQWFNAGNPFYGLYQIVAAMTTGGPLADILPDVLERYALFHGLVTAAFVAWAVVRLRPIALAQAGSSAKKEPRFRLTGRGKRRPVGRRPMLWKEVFIEGGLKFGWFGRILIALLVAATFVPVIIMVYFEVFDRINPRAANAGWLDWVGYAWDALRGRWDAVGQEVNVWVRSVNPIVSTLMLLGVAVRAAGAVGGERDRDTLVSLMTTPLTTAEIFWGKWVGSLASVRLFLWWLGAVWLIGLVTGAVGVLAIPLQVVAWVIPAGFVAGLGLYCSAACTTALRATTWAIVGTLFALGGHWLCVGMCCYAPLAAAGSGRGTDVQWAVYLELGLTPPFVFGWLPYREADELRLDRDALFPAMGVLAYVLWAVAAAVVADVAHRKFRELTNRVEAEVRLRPPGPPRPKLTG